MIVLGPMDADLCGAPRYWREGNWRPPSPDARKAGADGLAMVPSIPFDKCDVVLQYDARDQKRPLPADQGWDEKTSGSEAKHEPQNGALRIEASEGEVLFYQAAGRGRLEGPPESAAFYTVFSKEAQDADRDDGAVGWEAAVLAHMPSGRSRGMRATWDERYLYRAFDGPARAALAASVPHDTLTDLWHAAAIDGHLRGFKTEVDGADADDGGMTIASLDSLINNEPRVFFGYGEDGDVPMLFARFGKPEEMSAYRGRVRRFVASAPGRHVRAEFRAAALAKTVRVRLLTYADRPLDGSGGAASFRVSWASGSDVRPNDLPRDEITISRQFDASNFHRTVEVGLDIRPLTAGEPLWFAVERDWQSDADTLRATVHLLQVIVQAAR